MLPYEHDDFIENARMKLTNAATFNAQDSHHVLAVLSQRLSIDLVLAASEAIDYADRSVANHMRLLTSISSRPRTIYTYSPSEPILALAAARLLSSHDIWADVLNTFSKSLCQLGVVEKGLIGELAARTLLLIARDSVAQTRPQAAYPDMLAPVRFLPFSTHCLGIETGPIRTEGALRNRSVEHTSISRIG